MEKSFDGRRAWEYARSLIDGLKKNPYGFDFFRAVRLLECRRPDLPRVGFSLSPSEDPVRFCQKPSLRFAPSSLDSVTVDGDGGVPKMAVNFFGLFGPNAPLPPHITEYALERELHHKDHTITAFFNLFHHRLLTLFYRAWAANQKAADLDRPKDQRYAVYIGASSGSAWKLCRNAMPSRTPRSCSFPAGWRPRRETPKALKPSCANTSTSRRKCSRSRAVGFTCPPTASVKWANLPRAAASE